MSGWHLEYFIDVDLENRIVYEKIFGVWRIATAEAFVKDYEEQVKPLLKSKKPWVRLCDLTNWKTAYPEVVDIIGRHNAWCRAHHLAWSVNIIDNPVTYNQLVRMFDKGGTKGISRTFRTRAEAEQFLREQGFGAPVTKTPFR
ncbi:MAG: hypothetical protein AB1744_04090 [Candidatus Zixiibacteriota bacterium]